MILTRHPSYFILFYSISITEAVVEKILDETST